MALYGNVINFIVRIKTKGWQGASILNRFALIGEKVIEKLSFCFAVCYECIVNKKRRNARAFCYVPDFVYNFPVYFLGGISVRQSFAESI